MGAWLPTPGPEPPRAPPTAWADVIGRPTDPEQPPPGPASAATSRDSRATYESRATCGSGCSLVTYESPEPGGESAEYY